ncbi:MAG: hypothetical protein JWN44_1836 [Myxococcales bacterium]|nr:hypothetical protein [Myxococcales bacterium]
MARALAFMFVMVTCGCDDDVVGASQDLAAPSGIDLASATDGAQRADLSMGDASYTSGDASTFCAGTSVDSTCARAFFAKLAECFVPAGACSHHMPSSSRWQECWEDGAAMQLLNHCGDYTRSSREYRHGDQTCMTSELVSCAAPDVEAWTAGDGTMLTINLATGDVTCPDGTHDNVGPSYGNCAALGELIKRPTVTTCPADDAVACPSSLQ